MEKNIGQETSTEREASECSELLSRIKYAEATIKLMGEEIINHAPRREKQQARRALDEHLAIVSGLEPINTGLIRPSI